MHNRHAYPKQWRKLARACKELAGWRCSKCGVAHGTPRYSRWTEREWPVYLQAAHIHHDQASESPELVAVCPACHWKHYRKPGAHGWLYYERRIHQFLIQRAYLY